MKLYDHSTSNGGGEHSIDDSADIANQYNLNHGHRINKHFIAQDNFLIHV